MQHSDLVTLFDEVQHWDYRRVQSSEYCDRDRYPKLGLEVVLQPAKDRKSYHNAN
jgi:hypothetical protein